MAICDTGVGYGAEIACEITRQIADFVANAEASEDTIDTALTALVAAYDANIATPAYSPNLTGISYAFTAPTESPSRGDYASLQPPVVELPARAGLLSGGASDAIFGRAEGRIARAQAMAMRAALEDPSAIGIGLAAPVLLRRLADAAQKSTEAQLQSALEQAAQEGAWERDDIKAIIALELQNHQQKWSVISDRLKAEEDTFRAKKENYLAQVTKEGERRGWTELQAQTELARAKTDVDAAINWGRVALERLTQAEIIVVQMKAAVFQAWLQSAHMSMSTSGGFSVSTSTAN